MFIRSDFEAFKTISSRYTCSGENISPPLEFHEIPESANSLALIVDDPDAPHGTFDHWIVWNIPTTIQKLTQGAPELFSSHFKVLQGVNSYKVNSYKGPCPPPGKPHRYFFKLYALDQMLSLAEGATKSELEKAMVGHILEQTELVAIFER